MKKQEITASAKKKAFDKEAFKKEVVSNVRVIVQKNA